MISAPRFYTWRVAGRPVVVHLSLTVIDRIAEEALRGLGALPRRGAEVGGILLGAAERGDPLVVKIVDCLPVSCEHYFGPSYVLTQEEKQALEEALTRWRPLPSRAIYAVGYYRSHTRDDLFLSDEDVWLMSTYFADPSRVALLVKPRISGPNVGGFFIWEDGRIWTEYSHAEFPFDRVALGAGELEQEEETAAAVPGQVGEGLGVAEGGEVPASAAPESEFAIQAAEEEPAIRAPVEEPAAPREAETVAQAPKEEAAAPAPVERPAASVPEGGPAAQEPAPETTRLPSFLQAAKPVNAPGRRLDWKVPVLWVPVFMLLVLLGGWLGTQSAPHIDLGMLRNGGLSPYALRLAVTEYGDNLHLTWDRNAPALSQAERGILIIGDGDQTRSLELNAPQLQHGSVIYRRLSSPVRFRLELYLRGNRTVSEGWEPPPAQKVPAQP